MALEERDKKILMGVGIAAAVIVVLFLGKGLLFGGEEEPVDSAAGVPTDTSTGVATEAPTDPTVPPASGTGATASPVPTTSTSLNSFVFSDRDFFSPMPTPAVLDPSLTPSPSPGGTSGTTPSQLNIDGNSIKLNAVLNPKAPKVDVTVNEISYKAAPGDTFADDFSVVAIDSLTSCARFHWQANGSKGNEEDFTLCVA